MCQSHTSLADQSYTICQWNQTNVAYSNYSDRNLQNFRV